MDETTQTPEQPTTETPAVEPTAPVASEPTVHDFGQLTDDEVQAVIDEATELANGLANGDEEFTSEREQQFEAALARASAARAELAVRADRQDRHAEARQRAAELAAQPVRRPITAPAPAARPSVPRVADIPKPATPQVPEQQRHANFRMVIPTDAHNLLGPDRPQGTEFASFDEIGHALERRMDQYGSAGRGVTMSHTLALIRREYGNELTASRDNLEQSNRAIAFARDQRRLSHGSLIKSWQKSVEERGSLTAAAGWCAPSETLYDLCELESMDGLLDLPTITAARGGIRWTPEPTYAQLDALTSFTALTEAQVIADTPKTCAEIPCPPFTDTRMNIAATCLTGSFLQLRGYPELVARVERGAMAVHAHKLNEARIAAMVTQAGAATAISTPADDAVTSAILNAVELAATDIKYRNRMSFNSTLEVVLPFWALPLIRADFTRRTFGDPGLTDQQIAAWFAVRNIRPQWVYDWQDFYSGVVAPSVGSGSPFITSLNPASRLVNFLIYPAGAVVSIEQDVITLRNVYDSTNLQQNLYTHLFHEEGWNLIYPCPDLRQYSVLVCPSGATGATENWGCVADGA